MDRPDSKIAKPVILLCLFSILAGCAGSQQTERSSDTSAPTDLQRYEEEFRPSDYDKNVEELFSELRVGKKGTPPVPDAAIPGPEVAVPGYRVQIFATSEIDAANLAKEEAETAFPGEWFYIEYDPPTYKVRAGNFLNRSDAEAYARVLSDNGYPDAWIVPDRVLKNIKPRPAPSQSEQHRPE